MDIKLRNCTIASEIGKERKYSYLTNMVSSLKVLLVIGILARFVQPSVIIDEKIFGGEKCPVDVAKVVISLFICIVGLFGNLIAIFVILVLKEYQKSVTHWYVLQLAIADSIFLLTLPFKVSEDLNHAWIYPDWMCKAKETILFLNYYASILFLVVMSVDRYIAVCQTFSEKLQKLRKRLSSYIITACVWIISLLLCIPVMLYSHKIGTDPYCECSYEFPNPTTFETICFDEGFDTPDLLASCLQTFSDDSTAYCKKQDFSKGSSSDQGSESDISDGNIPPHKGSLYSVDHNTIVNTTGYDGLLNSTDYNGLDTDYDELLNKTDFSQMFNNTGYNGPLNNTNVFEFFNNTDFGDIMDLSGSGSAGGSNNETSSNDSVFANCHYWQHPVGWKAYLLFNFFVMFMLPLIVMVVSYGLIVRRLSTTRMRTTSTPSSSSISQHHSVKGAGSSKKRKKSASRSDKDRRRVTIMCATLVICFVVCWLPFHSIHLAKIQGIRSSTGEICTVLAKVGTLLGYLNSALNPYLYSFLGTNFSRRWKDATNTVRISTKRRVSSSSGGQGTGRNTHKKAGREGSSSVNTATVMTKIHRNQIDMNNRSSETRTALEVSQAVGYNTETQQLNTTILQCNGPIGFGSPPPDYEQSLGLQ